jgi:SOS-response transcriptional repressor LexA
MLWSWLGGLILRWVDVRAKLMPWHASGCLNGNHSLGWNPAVPMQPIPNVRLAHANQSGEGGLSTCQRHCSFEGRHMPPLVLTSLNDNLKWSPRKRHPTSCHKIDHFSLLAMTTGCVRKSSHMKDLPDRLKAARKRLNLSQRKLGDRVGLSQAAINKIEAGNTLQPRTIKAIAAALECEPEWLEYGKNPPAWAQQDRQAQDTAGAKGEIFTAREATNGAGKANIDQAPIAKRSVPLISWVRAGAFEEAVDLHPLGLGDELIEVTVSCSRTTYALRVRGESMLDPAGGAHSFAEGDIIVVDPERAPIHRSYVVAKLASVNEVTFKQLIYGDGGKMLLKAINPRWPQPYIEMTDGCQVIGVVVEKVQRTAFV